MSIRYEGRGLGFLTDKDRGETATGVDFFWRERQGFLAGKIGERLPLGVFFGVGEIRERQGFLAGKTEVSAVYGGD